MSVLKQQYNEMLARMNKAMMFMSGPAPMEEKEKWQPEFVQIEKRLTELIGQIGGMTEDEILNGFEEV